MYFENVGKKTYKLILKYFRNSFVFLEIIKNIFILMMFFKL